MTMRIDRRTKKTRNNPPQNKAVEFVEHLVKETAKSCEDFKFPHHASPKSSIGDVEFQKNPVLHSFFHFVNTLKLNEELGGGAGTKVWIHYLCVVQSLYQYVPYHNKLHPGFILLNVLNWLAKGETHAGKPVVEGDHFSHLKENKDFKASSAIAVAVSVLNHDIAHPGYGVMTEEQAQLTKPFSFFYDESNFKDVKSMYLELGHGLFAIEILDQFKNKLPGTFGHRVKGDHADIAKIKKYYTHPLKHEEFHKILKRTDSKSIVENIYQTILMTAVFASKPIVSEWKADSMKKGEIHLSSMLMKAADLSIPFAEKEERYILSSFVNVEFVGKEHNNAADLAKSVSGGQKFFKDGIGGPFFELAGKLLFNEKAKIVGEHVHSGFIKTQDEIIKDLDGIKKEQKVDKEKEKDPQDLFKEIYDAAQEMDYKKFKKDNSSVENTYGKTKTEEHYLAMIEASGLK